MAIAQALFDRTVPQSSASGFASHVELPEMRGEIRDCPSSIHGREIAVPSRRRDAGNQGIEGFAVRRPPDGEEALRRTVWSGGVDFTKGERLDAQREKPPPFLRRSWRTAPADLGWTEPAIRVWARKARSKSESHVVPCEDQWSIERSARFAIRCVALGAECASHSSTTRRTQSGLVLAASFSQFPTESCT